MVLSVLTNNMERNQINYDLMLNLFEKYKRQSNTSFYLSEEEKIRAKNFSRELSNLVQTRKLHFSDVFQSKDRYSTGYITVEDLKGVLLYDLYMDQSPDMLTFFRYMNPLNDGKIPLAKLKEEYNI